VSVGTLLRGRPDALGIDLELVAGAEGLDRLITIPYIQKTGLALAGFDEFLKAGRVLVLGGSEIRFLETLTPEARTQALSRAFARELPCVVITEGNAAPPELSIECERAKLPLLRTSLSTLRTMARLTAVLEDRLAAREIVHGVLLDILGLGVLVIGESGIGKSECALDLVVRGHRLVADDTVEVRRRAETILIGTCPPLTRYHMEIRGLGVINVRDLFGIASARSSKRIELVVQLERWDPGREYDRLGLDAAYHDLLGMQVPMVRMPVAPGRNVAMLVEVAARNHLVKVRGHHAARELAARVDRRLRRRFDAEPPDEADADSDSDPGESW
jgi:HPr kinase/phosphorylase